MRRCSGIKTSARMQQGGGCAGGPDTGPVAEVGPPSRIDADVVTVIVSNAVHVTFILHGLADVLTVGFVRGGDVLVDDGQELFPESSGAALSKDVKQEEEEALKRVEYTEEVGEEEASLPDGQDPEDPCESEEKEDTYGHSDLAHDQLLFGHGRGDLNTTTRCPIDDKTKYYEVDNNCQSEGWQEGVFKAIAGHPTHFSFHVEPISTIIQIPVIHKDSNDR